MAVEAQPSSATRSVAMAEPWTVLMVVMSNALYSEESTGMMRKFRSHDKARVYITFRSESQLFPHAPHSILYLVFEGIVQTDD